MTPDEVEKMSTESAYERADRVVGLPYMADRLLDVQGISCATCWALVNLEKATQHADWHISRGEAPLNGTR